MLACSALPTRGTGLKTLDDLREPRITTKAIPRRIELELAVIGATRCLREKH